MSTCRPTPPPRSARPACWVHCTSSWRRRRTRSPEGKLHDGSLIPLSRGAAYPSTEQTLAAVSLLLNGGGIGQIQDITTGVEHRVRRPRRDLRSLITQLDSFVSHLNDQTDDIIAATDSLNNLVGQFADQKPVWTRRSDTFPTR